MDKTAKLLEQARRNPGGIPFRDFEALLSGSGFRFDRQSGSHRIHIAPTGERLSIQNRNGMAKEYQVRQAIRLIDKE